MFQQQFYHELIKKYVTLFGTMFTNTFIERYDADGNQIASIKVPIMYAPKEKMLTRLLADPDIDRQYAVLLPRMSFEITSPGFRYDASRKLTSINRVWLKDVTNANKMLYQYNPVPYNIFFSLYVYVKSVEDGLRIIEQIVPNFTPDITFNVHLVPEMNEHRDVAVEFTDGPIMTDIYTDDFKTRRMIYWTLNFTMRGYFFGPVKKAPIIKYANTVLRIGTSNANGNIDTTVNSIIQTTVMTPGYTGSGPTTNAAASIPVNEIFIDDDFGFVATRTDFIG